RSIESVLMRAARAEAVEVATGTYEIAQGEDAREACESALRALLSARPAPARGTGEEPIVVDPAMIRLHEQARRVAATNVRVLVVGETGAGKEVFARIIHAASGRKGQLISVNAAALPENLLESELFGHERGAFSGATTAKVGLIEAADKGTL